MDRFERNFRAMTNTLEDLANIGVRVYSIFENLELANTLTVNLFGIIGRWSIVSGTVISPKKVVQPVTQIELSADADTS